MTLLRDKFREKGIGRSDMVEMRVPKECVFNYVFEQNFKRLKSLVIALVPFIWPDNAEVVIEALKQAEYEPMLCIKTEECGVWVDKGRCCRMQSQDKIYHAAKVFLDAGGDFQWVMEQVAKLAETKLPVNQNHRHYDNFESGKERE